MKKKLLITLAIVLGIPLFMFINLVIYFIIFDDSSSTDKPSASRIEEQNKSDGDLNKDNTDSSDDKYSGDANKDNSESSDNKSVDNINKDDIDSSDNKSNDDSENSNNDSVDEAEIITIDTSKIQVKKIDSVTYADAEKFIDSFASADMSEGMHYFYFERIDKDTMEDYLTKYENGEEYFSDEFAHLLDLDAFLVNSWFTDTPVYMMFIDSTEAVVLGDTAMMTEEPTKIITIDKAPKIVDGKVYVPIDAFADITGFKVKIKN